jgi:hypothetical protein
VLNVFVGTDSWLTDNESSLDDNDNNDNDCYADSFKNCIYINSLVPTVTR